MSRAAPTSYRWPKISLGIKRAALGATWLVLVALFYVPTTTLVDMSLDVSNYHSYSYFVAHGFQYGTDVIAMAGPYGFATYGYVYGGDLLWIRQVFEFALIGLFAAFILWFAVSARCHPLLRLGWLAALVMFTSTIDDATIDWLTLLAGLWLLAGASRNQRLAALLVCGALLPLLALVKGTHLYLVLATFGLISIERLLAGEFRQAARRGAAFVMGFVVWWLLAGQNPAHIPAFLRGLNDLATGYNAAMGLEESPVTFHRGLLAAGCLAAALAWAAWHFRRQRAALAGVLLLAGFTFVAWKHAFVRADGHVFLFFNFVIVAAFTWRLYVSFFADDAAAEARGPRAVTLLAVCLPLLAGLYGVSDGFGPRLRWMTDFFADAVADRLVSLAKLPSVKATLDARLAERRHLTELPLIRQTVGQARVDFFGVEHGVIPLNQLNYAPRPMSGGTFNVYTPRLMALNQAYLQDDARAPEYYLVKLGTIDGRLLALDDALAFRELITHYRPQLFDHGYVLARRQTGVISPVPQQLDRREIQLGKPIEVPSVPSDRLLLAAFDLRPSWRGWLRAKLYKPSPMQIELRGTRTDPVRRRFIPSMAAVPILFSPLLDNTTDYLSLFEGKADHTVKEFLLTSPDGDDYAPGSTVTFYTIPAPVPLPAGEVETLHAFLRFPVTNVAPSRVSPPIPSQKIIDGLLVHDFHTPASVSWKLVGNERELDFDYGFDPEAYQRGKSDGAEFIVELVMPDGRIQPVFHRFLDPAKHPADRGRQSAQVVLPPVPPGGELVLRADPGPFGDTGWDWTYVARVQITRGPFRPEQFPHFNRVPVAVNFSASGLVEESGRTVFMLNAPGSMTFALQPTDTRVGFDYGFLAGAYGGGGATDGAGYTLELLRTGQPPKVILRRELAPGSHPQDQGEQHARLTLPPPLPGDELRLTIDTGPAGNGAWDWTFVANFLIE